MSEKRQHEKSDQTLGNFFSLPATSPTLQRLGILLRLRMDDPPLLAGDRHRHRRVEARSSPHYSGLVFFWLHV